MAIVKQLSSFMALNIDGGDRISFTYNEVDEETGDPISLNNKQTFFAVDPELVGHVEAIRAYIREKKLMASD